MTKLFLTSDWHLGKTQYDDKQREQDFYDSAFFIINKAIKNNIKYILNAGDVFDLNKPKFASVKVLKEINKLLIDNNITMLTMMGNHDFTIDGSWCELFEDHPIYGIKDISNKLAILPDTNIKVYGIIGKSATEIKSGFLKNEAIDADIIMLHCPCKEIVSDFGRDDILSIKKDFCENSEIDKSLYNKNKIFLIGDTHKTVIDFCKDKKESLSHAVISPGSIEMVYSNEDLVKNLIEISVGQNGEYETIKEVNLETNYRRVSNINSYIKSEEDLDSFIKTELLNPIYDLVNERVILYVYYYIDSVSNIESRLNNIIKVNPKSSIRLVPKVNPEKLKINLVSEESSVKYSLKSLQDFVKDNEDKIILDNDSKALFFDLLEKQRDTEQIKDIIDKYICT
jgi:DNA repair exonuclease SbcCD nuclease subunit